MVTILVTSARVLLTSSRGIIGPWLVSQNMAFGTPVSTSDPKWDGLMSYLSLANEFASADHPSPRFWLLWPGVACMVAVGLTGMYILKSSSVVLIEMGQNWHSSGECFGL